MLYNSIKMPDMDFLKVTVRQDICEAEPLFYVQVKDSKLAHFNPVKNQFLVREKSKTEFFISWRLFVSYWRAPHK